MQACRDRLKNIPLDKGQHAGLLLSRYLKIPVKENGHAQGDKKGEPGARGKLHAAAKSAAVHSKGIYEQAFRRWQSSLPKPCVSKTLHVHGRLVVGLGGENVLETGVTLHHTYGVPVIPGSALKGLAAHYAHTVWGAAGKKWKKAGAHHKTVFGAHHKTVFGAHDDAGHIVFHAAWIVPDSLSGDGKSGLVLDAITPHHSGYYAGHKYEGGEKNGQLIPPTDFDDPNPVTFLSVAGSFIVAVSCDVDGNEGAKWATLAFDLLAEALKEWGAGGKTSGGYGRMSENKPAPVVGSAAQTLPPALPRPGGKVEGILLEEKTTKGGWRARHEPSRLAGPIQNTGDVPGDKKPGDKLALIVASSNERGIAFRYPTAADEERARKGQANPKAGPSRNQGRRGFRR